MELILAVLGAGPIGFLTKTRRQGLLVYLVAWAVVFPIQSAIVGIYSDFDPLYLVVNAVILAAGVGLNRLGSILREKRAMKRRAVAEVA